MQVNRPLESRQSSKDLDVLKIAIVERLES